MAIGPVELLVLGFRHPDFRGEVLAELDRLRSSDTIRVIDAVIVHKDETGRVGVEHLTNLTRAEGIELGGKIGALVGLGAEGEAGAVAGMVAGTRAAGREGVRVFRDEQVWDILAEIPNDSAATLLLVEHHWAVPLRDALLRTGGFRVGDVFISPFDLVDIGLTTRQEAEQLTSLDSPPTAGER
ncbi:hypothetical protein [Kutzneria sp. CA-103260]|uniref:hypothetical protein n=1 Tax=Kutzneria sp. CA-103260 TaxID=2802641 RepID=UPI001BA6964F|nr:hypothetical protein [Kutzneria sp. CA-103260]QUQ66211.1 hypothetical protein JJ691_39370 [Kutzneria sp. CA-103260]